MRLFVILLSVFLPFSLVKADESDAVRLKSQGWYVGIEGGIPFGLSTFSSFGHDKTRLGWAAGVYGGYRFNPIFSAELFAKYGEMNLTAQPCCTERNYWLGSDGMLYQANVLGMDCWEYADLKSHVKMGQYGARVKINLLGLLRKTSDSRWEIAVSPHVYAVTTKADVHTIADEAEIIKGSTRWHFGYGADLQVGYRLTSYLNLGIYSGVTRLTGKRMDGMPEHLHKNNFVWESGIRLGVNLAKRQKNPKSQMEKVVEASPISSLEVLQEEPTTPRKENLNPKEPVEQVETKVIEQAVAEQRKVKFPVIYFAFNRIDISQNAISKLKAILEILNENPEMEVMVTGWCDTKGSVAVNKRISRQRAEAVKAWLVRHGVAASRISVEGKGSDDMLDAKKARRVETIDIHESKDNHNQ